MLLSRKRALRDIHSSEELRAAGDGDGAPSTTDGKRLLRDLVGGSPCRRREGDPLLNLLDRLQERVEPAHTPSDKSLALSRARLSSQELFLSVVLEWQRSHDADRLEEVAESPTAAVFRHDRAFHSITTYAASSVSSYASSDDDDERDDGVVAVSHKNKKTRLLDEISPTSVHHVPAGALSPLSLSLTALQSPMKRIGIYTPRARQELLRKYTAKRVRRLSQHKVRYGVRKTLANARPRVKGRFVKTESPLTAAIVESLAPADK